VLRLINACKQHPRQQRMQRKQQAVCTFQTYCECCASSMPADKSVCRQQRMQQAAFALVTFS
jgi:hypothetical protein